MNLCTTIPNHHLVYLLALQLRRVGRDRRGRGTRGERSEQFLCVLAFHWLPSPGWTHPLRGVNTFSGPWCSEGDFPCTHIPNKSSGPAVETTIKQSSLFAEIRFSKMPTAEQGHSLCLLQKKGA